jgi:hypothetical protein
LALISLLIFAVVLLVGEKMGIFFNVVGLSLPVLSFYWVVIGSRMYHVRKASQTEYVLSPDNAEMFIAGRSVYSVSPRNRGVTIITLGNGSRCVLFSDSMLAPLLCFGTEAVSEILLKDALGFWYYDLYPFIDGTDDEIPYGDSYTGNA